MRKIHFLLVLSACMMSTAPRAQLLDPMDCPGSPRLPALPAIPNEQQDFQRSNIYLQNMQIVGTRYFTAESDLTSPYDPHDIIAGSNAASDLCPTCSTGLVVIARHPKVYDQRWQPFHEYTTGNVVIPTRPNGHKYIATTTINEDDVGGGEPAWPEYHHGLTTMRGQTSELCGIAVNGDHPGVGYEPSTTITISPPTSGTQATADVIVDDVTGEILSIRMTNFGSGYTSPPTVTLNSNNGSEAILDVVMNTVPNAQDGWEEIGRTLTDPWSAEKSYNLRDVVKPATDDLDPIGYDYLYRVVQTEGSTSNDEPGINWGSDGVVRWSQAWFDKVVPKYVTDGYAGTPAEQHQFFQPQAGGQFVYQLKSAGHDWPLTEPQIDADDLGITDTKLGYPGQFYTDLQGNPWEAPGDPFDGNEPNLLIWWPHVNADNYPEWSAGEPVSIGTKRKHTSLYPTDRWGRNAGVVEAVAAVKESNEPTWSRTEGDEFKSTPTSLLTWKNVGIDAADVDFRATGYVRLINGFHVQKGARFHAYIKPRLKTTTTNEFSTTTLPTTDWTPTDDDVKGWDPDQASIVAGVLTLKSSWSSTENRHLNGEIISKLGYNYGKFEVDAKVPTTRGAFSAFWLANVCCPMDELDVFERADWYPLFRQGHHCESYLAHTDQGWNFSPKHPQGAPSYRGHNYEVGWNNYQDDWHNYSFEWRPGHMVWMVDDEVVFRLPQKGHVETPRLLTGLPLSVILGYSTNEQACGLDESEFLVDRLRISALKTIAEKQVDNSYIGAPRISSKPATSLIKRIQLTPNPASGKEVTAKIELVPGLKGIGRFEIYDLLGVLKLGYDIGDVSQTSTAVIPLNETITSGNYVAAFILRSELGTEVKSQKLSIVR